MQFMISVAFFALFLFAIIDVIMSDQSRIKHLGKVTWLFIVILLPLIGSILWFVIGKEYDRSPVEVISFGDPRRVEPAPRSTNEQELAAIEAEIAFHENEARIRRLEEELQAKRDKLSGS